MFRKQCEPALKIWSSTCSRRSFSFCALFSTQCGASVWLPANYMTNIHNKYGPWGHATWLFRKLIKKWIPDLYCSDLRLCLASPCGTPLGEGLNCPPDFLLGSIKHLSIILSSTSFHGCWALCSSSTISRSGATSDSHRHTVIRHPASMSQVQDGLNHFSRTCW